MKKKILSILTFLAVNAGISAQTPDFVWAKSLGGTSSEVVQSIGLDGLGYVYTVGSFQGSLDFDPGLGTSVLTSNGGTDVFIQKLDANGDFVWAKKLGGTSFENPKEMVVDAAGNVYVTGYFQSTSDFDPGVGVFNLTSSGSVDVFITKLDASGNFVWAKSMGATNYDSGRTIDVDGAGNVYITGTFQNIVDFNPGVGVNNLTAVGNSDSFIQKLDLNGNFVWVKQLEGSGSAYISSVNVDALGNIHAVGHFDGTVDFDFAGGVQNITSNGYNDIFISKWDNNGAFIWVKSMGGNLDHDEANSVDVDALGNVYTTGFYVGTVDFDPGIGVSNLIAAGTQDVFISKLNASGNFVWAKSMGGTNYDVGNSVIVDGVGNVYTTGYFRGTADFNPGAGVTNLISGGADDVFVQKLDVNGDFVWANAITGTGVNNGISIAIDGLNNVYTAGNYRNTADFDPEIGVANLTSNGIFDVFIQKLKQCETVGVDTQVACDSYTWIDGNTYTSSNSVATDTLTNAEGCDSVVTLNLTINYSNTGTDVQSACSTFTWIDGNTYTTSNNVATHTLTNYSGCDSLVTLNLSINSNTGIDIQAACNSFTWIDGNTYTNSNNLATHTLTNVLGCDSVVTLDLTINTPNTGLDVQVACNKFTWIDGLVYTSSNNTATYTLTNYFGCDSVVTLDLTINNLDVGVTLLSNTLSANNTSATSYQWINCLDNSMIAGATNISYTATANGDYAVIVNGNLCSDSSSCVSVLTVGVTEFENQKISIYPNPTKNQLTINGVEASVLTMSILDVTGKVVKIIDGNSTTINVTDLTNGIYFLQLQTIEGLFNSKFIKE